MGETQGVTNRQTAAAPASRPGLAAAAGTAVLSGLLCWFWLIPQLAAEARPGAGAADAPARLAEVADTDIAGALSTTDLPPATAARLRQEPRSCQARLASITLTRADRAVPEVVRIQSGPYFSPLITLPDSPVRVAIPFPGPYASGEGNLTVLGAQAGAVLALAPPWSVPPKTASATHRVTWHPSAECKQP